MVQARIKTAASRGRGKSTRKLFVSYDIQGVLEPQVRTAHVRRFTSTDGASLEAIHVRLDEKVS